MPEKESVANEKTKAFHKQQSNGRSPSTMQYLTAPRFLLLPPLKTIHKLRGSTLQQLINWGETLKISPDIVN